jgi:hypothetical protein
MINDNWMRSISKSYKQLNEQQMMMGMQGGMPGGMQQSPMPQQQKKRYHHPFRKQTAGPIQDEGPASVEPPKQQGMPFPGPGMPGEIPGPSGLPIGGQEQSIPMMGQMGQMGQMGRQMPQMGQMGRQMPQMGQMGQQMPQMGQMGQMGQPQQPQIQIAQMGTFKQPFGEVPGQLGQMPPMGQMGQMGQPQFGAPGQNIQQALSKTRPITKIESLENRDVPAEFRYTPRPEQQQPQMGQMGQQMPPMGQMGQMPKQGGEEQTGPNKKLSPKEIKAMFDRFKKKGMKKR